jgi:PAS domain S-box-containing protein
LNTQQYYTLAHIPIPALRLDSTGQVTDVNTALSSLFQYNAKELLQHPIEQIMPVEVKQQHPLSWRQLALKTNKDNLTQLVTMVRKDQSVIQVRLTFAELADDYLVFFQLVNDTESLSGQSNVEMTEKMLDSIDEPYWMWDLEQDIVHYSAQFMALLGYKAETFIGPRAFWQQHIEQYVLDEINAQISSHLQGELGNIHTSCQITTQQNELKWVDMSAKVLEYRAGRAIKMFGLLRDITELKSLIKNLKKQNDFLTLAEQLNQSGHWRVDLVNNSLYWSLGMYVIHGVDPLEFEPSVARALKFYLEDERARVWAYLADAVKHKQGFHYKSTIKQKLGDLVRVEVIGEVEVNQQGEVTSIFGVFRDISKDEEQIEKLKLLALVHNTINVPVFFIDEKDNVVYQELIPQKEAKKGVLFNYINFTITDYLAFKKQAREVGQVIRKNISFDNFISVFDLSVTFEQDERIYIWVVDNVTDKFKKEQQQIISNRLALLGNTFGNVSHDINNVLGVALGSVEMLEMKLKQGDQNINKYVERVKNAIDKGKSVTERLLAFTRKPNIDVALFDPIQDIKDNQYLFEQLLLSTINLTINLTVAECQIKFPKGEFINILLNIVLNAQDAIQENGVSGKIDISAQINAYQKLEIHIKDSGSGIADENLTRIFDPFYSSKSINKGNGIGLANVYNTMYKHNGEIQVEGHGALGGAHFTLLFPCTVHKEALLQAEKAVKTNGISGKNVLVLDDEVSIGEFVALYLEQQGAVPICISSRQELIATLAEKPPLEVFVTDMILPDLSGREAVNLVRQVYPEIKVYSISGYIAVEESSWEYPVLRKPFNSAELAAFLS